MPAGVRRSILTLDPGLTHSPGDDHRNGSRVQVLCPRGPVIHVCKDKVFDPVFTDIGSEPFVELLLQVHKVITVPRGPAFSPQIHTDLVSIDDNILDPEPGDLTVTESVEQGELDHEEVPSCSLPLEIHQVRPELLNVPIGKRIPNRLTWRPFYLEIEPFADIRINSHCEARFEVDVVIEETEETLQHVNIEVA